MNNIRFFTTILIVTLNFIESTLPPERSKIFRIELLNWTDKNKKLEIRTIWKLANTCDDLLVVGSWL